MKLENITIEIHIQQSISNRLTVPTYYYLLDHLFECTYAIRQYPWHDLEGLLLEKYGNPQIPLDTYFDQKTYNLYPTNLANIKIRSPNKNPNCILKNIPQKFQIIFF